MNKNTSKELISKDIYMIELSEGVELSHNDRKYYKGEILMVLRNKMSYKVINSSIDEIPLTCSKKYLYKIKLEDLNEEGVIHSD